MVDFITKLLLAARKDTILVVLQTQVLSVGQVNESCIRVNTRELNRELCTELFTFIPKLHDLC